MNRIGRANKKQRGVCLFLMLWLILSPLQVLAHSDIINNINVSAAGNELSADHKTDCANESQHPMETLANDCDHCNHCLAFATLVPFYNDCFKTQHNPTAITLANDLIIAVESPPPRTFKSLYYPIG